LQFKSIVAKRREIDVRLGGMDGQIRSKRILLMVPLSSLLEWLMVIGRLGPPVGMQIQESGVLCLATDLLDFIYFIAFVGVAARLSGTILQLGNYVARSMH
jgi:hypothetical protein